MWPWFVIGLLIGTACCALTSSAWRGFVAAACLVVAFALAVRYGHA